MPDSLTYKSKLLIIYVSYFWHHPPPQKRKKGSLDIKIQHMFSATETLALHTDDRINGSKLQTVLFHTVLLLEKRKSTSDITPMTQYSGVNFPDKI